LTPNHTSSEENAGRGLGGAMGMIPVLRGFVGIGSGGGAGWSNTNEGEVIATAFLAAHN
jgi:hypothetical protein